LTEYGFPDPLTITGDAVVALCGFTMMISMLIFVRPAMFGWNRRVATLLAAIAGTDLSVHCLLRHETLHSERLAARDSGLRRDVVREPEAQRV